MLVRARDSDQSRRNNAFKGRLPLAVTCVLLSFVFGVRSQSVPDEFPPPLKTISESEEARLRSSRNQTEELRITRDLMEARLTAAESAIRSGDELGMFFELGAFHALMERMLERLLDSKSAKRSSSQISNLKRFEMTLRGYPSRIELIRRRSFEFDSYINDLQLEIRRARTRSLEPMFVAPEK